MRVPVPGAYPIEPAKLGGQRRRYPARRVDTPRMDLIRFKPSK